MFFEPGRNCWRVADAHRAAFLVDGEDYFRAFAEACEGARSTIYILGWDIDSRIRLRRGEHQDRENFAAFVDRLARENPALRVYILEWDFAMLYALERDGFPLLSFGWRTHERVRFALDNQHPVGASHHQKVVVVDDCLAFVGGLDLASRRWDTSEHLPEHRDRCDNETPYDPFHDVQVIVEGPVAEELGRLCRTRWQRATGECLPAVDNSEQSSWPEAVAAAMDDVRVAILRTEPASQDRPAINEIENFYCDAIARAGRFIYIENQYLTSHKVCKALEGVLEQEAGPEILLVMPQECSGWMEQETMGKLRHGLLSSLQAKDRFGRFKVCYPGRADLGSKRINVHSKVMVVDDRLLTVGSANLSNRSMGFDTECNLALSSTDQPHAAPAIAGLRDRLLAEHLGTSPQTVAEQLAASGSLLSTVAALDNDLRFLRDLAVETVDIEEGLLAQKFVDPERPVDMEALFDHFSIDTEPSARKGGLGTRVWISAALLAVALLLAILWRWSPLGQWLDKDSLLSAVTAVRDYPGTIPIVLLAYVIGSCLMVPVTLLILVTVMGFGPYLGFALAWVGSLLGGLAGYLVGRWIGRDVVRSLAGEHLNRLSRKLARKGCLTVAILRTLPVAPFMVVNMVAGASHISLPSFISGTALGMAPGILVIAILQKGVYRALEHPDGASLALAVMALIIYAVVFLVAKGLLSRWDKGEV